MERLPVNSSQIASIGYDPGTKTLEVEFKSFNKDKPASVYQYDDVEPETHAALTSADSIGKHFGAHIKAGGYKYRKVEQEKVA